MKTVYRITLYHGEKSTTWQSPNMPNFANGVFSFKDTDGMAHWVMGTVEITQFEQP